MKNLPGGKKRVLKCMTCDEEWGLDKQSGLFYPLNTERSRPQDLYTGDESEFWHQVHEIDRLHKKGIL